ncbi:MAG: cytoplasmic protein [Deltaproteobacteria bacterium RIFOXYD12_FULL_57_12]|nr:MAG: cytoplasmic protein [Deltaproteobacteria bacterium RIFOXYD12_FULL_57_12]
MSRRNFLIKTVLTGAALSLPTGLDTLARAVAGTPPPASLVMATGPSAAAVTRAAIGGLGGISRFIAKGDVVVIKPNMSWDRVPEQAGNTNPEVVATVVALCLEAGAKSVTLFDRPVNDPRRCYVQSGIGPAAEKAGGRVEFMNDRRFKKMAIGGMVLKEWPIYRDVVEADKLINIPIAKHHSRARLSMSMKNWMGVLGGDRSTLHQRLDECLVDLAGFIRPTLTVLDAVRVLVANGPQGGDLADVKRLDTVIAGIDQVAIDALGATLFGLQGSDLGYVRLGHQRGLGNMRLDPLHIIKLSV